MIEIRKTGITVTEAQAVVNAANSRLLQGGGVCGAIFRAAGAARLQKACDDIGGCETGNAVITPGFALCPYIIHAVGPIYEDGNHDEETLLYSCYISSLNLALEHSISSIAFPLISAGIYGYPLEKAWKTALKACKEWSEKHLGNDIQIIFTIPEQHKYDMGKEIMKQV